MLIQGSKFFYGQIVTTKSVYKTLKCHLVNYYLVDLT